MGPTTQVTTTTTTTFAVARRRRASRMTRATTTTTMMMMIRGARRNDRRHRFGRATTTIGALHTDEAMGDGKEDNDASSSSSKMMMMMTDQKAFVDDVVTRAADAARASAERYDFASAFVGSMLCATWFVMRGQSVETALMIVFCATITAVVAEELLQDVERDGGGR